MVNHIKFDEDVRSIKENKKLFNKFMIINFMNFYFSILVEYFSPGL